MSPPRSGKALGTGRTEGQDAEPTTTPHNVDTDGTARCDSFRPSLAELVRRVGDAGPDKVAAVLAEVCSAGGRAGGREADRHPGGPPALSLAAATQRMSQGAAEALLLAAVRDRSLQ
jgi:hypothetical protein